MLGLSRGRPEPVPDQQMAIVGLVLQAMATAERQLITMAMQQQQEILRFGEDSDEGLQRRQQMTLYTSLLANRPTFYDRAAYVAPISLDTIPADVDVLDAYGRFLRGEPTALIDMVGVCVCFELCEMCSGFSLWICW